MAQSNLVKISDKSLYSLSCLMKDILHNSQRFTTELVDKLSVIDVAYSMYKNSQKQGDGTGTDIIHGEMECGVAVDEFTIPVVISQVDSFVGYLAEVYLSGFPFFPVASTPNNIKEAEQLESIIDTHAVLGGYGRQLLKAFKNGIKYNLMPIMLEWEAMPTYSVASTVISPTERPKINRGNYMYNKLTALDMYNTVWDREVSPSDVAARGAFAGELSLISRIELKRLLLKYTQLDSVYNYGNSLKSSVVSTGKNTSSFYQRRPTISDYVSSKKGDSPINWMSWAKNNNPRYKDIVQDSIYERFKCYVRLIPSEHLINNVPEPNMPQIWKIDMILPGTIICAQRIFTSLDLLPIMIGQPLEDDFDLQTKSIAENNITFQESASKLINIRFASARRAVSDRALYDPNLIRASDINSPTPAPKIPVRIPLGSNKTIADAHQQIPYDDTATEGVVQDSQRIVEFSQMLYGTNRAVQGQFQKGNKSRKEWDDVMAFTNNRLRLPTITTEYQIMVPLKEQIKWNIFQYREGGVFQHYASGETTEIGAAEFEAMQKKILSFKVGDGYTPTSKLASTELLTAGLQMVSTSPILQQYYGQSLPGMFAHMMSLGGVHDLDQYSPENTKIAPVSQPGTVPVIPASGQ